MAAHTPGPNVRVIEAAPELLDALRDLVERADTTALADGSSLDTAWAHALLARFDAPEEE